MYTSCISIWRTILCVCLAFGYVQMNERNNGKKSLLDDDGGFTINIYISDNIIDNVTESFVGAIKEHFGYASDTLYHATHKSFYFRAINIYVPNDSTLTNSTTIQDGEDDPECEDYSFIVDAPNPLYGNTPYTKHSGTCGKQGEYVHLTDSYITSSANATLSRLQSKWGEMKKVIVHEFAHWRWGVGEEYARPNSGDKQYYVNKEGKKQPNVCSKEITGRWVRPNSNGTECADGISETCIFIPHTNETGDIASLMSFPQVAKVGRFCDKASHNSDAQIQHNLMCNGKSVMEVIRSSGDCRNGMQNCNIPKDRRRKRSTDSDDGETCMPVILSTLTLDDAIPIPLNHRSGGYLNIFSSFRFNTSGKVTTWRYFARTEGNFSLSVWRDLGNGTLKMIGINHIISDVTNEIKIQNITLDEQIDVQPCDMIGAIGNGVLYFERSNGQKTAGVNYSELGEYMSTRIDESLTVNFTIDFEKKKDPDEKSGLAVQAMINECGGSSLSPQEGTTDQTCEQRTPGTTLSSSTTLMPIMSSTTTSLNTQSTDAPDPYIRVIRRKPETDYVMLIIEPLKESNNGKRKGQLIKLKDAIQTIYDSGQSNCIVIHRSETIGVIKSNCVQVSSYLEEVLFPNSTNDINVCSIVNETLHAAKSTYKAKNPLFYIFTNGDSLNCENQKFDKCLFYDRHKLPKPKEDQYFKCKTALYLSEREPLVLDGTSPTCSIKTKTPDRISIFSSTSQNFTLYKEKGIQEGELSFVIPCDVNVSVILQQNVTRINADINKQDIGTGCLRRIKLDQLKEGEVNISISSTHRIDTSISYTGKPVPGEKDLVLLDTKLNVLSFNYSDESSRDLIVMATLTSGSYPVIKATVKARIYMTDLESNEKIFISEIPLWDNGIGVDAEANDGIYSNQIVSFKGDGGLSVDVTVDNKDKHAQVKKHMKSGANDLFALYNKVEEPVIENTDPFQRYSPPLIIEVVNLPENGTDLYPPARVTDLFVIDIIQERRIATIRFTVTGDDIMQGKASRVEVRSSESTEELLQNFTAATLIADITSLELPGEVMTENLEFQGKGAIYYVVALKVIDDAGKESDISNTASFYFENIAQAVTGNSQFTTTTAFTEVKSTQLSMGKSVEGSLDIDTLLKIVIPIVVGLVILTAVGAIICYCVYKKRHTNKAPPPPTIADINPYYNTLPPRTTEPDSMGDNPENCLPHATEHGFTHKPDNHHVVSIAPAIHDCTDRPNMNIKPIRDSGLYTKTIQPIDPMPMIPHSALHENPAQYKPNDIPALPPKQRPPAIPEKKHKKNNLDKIVLNARDKLKPVERKRIIHQATIPEDGDSDDIYDDTSAPEMRQKHENLSMNDKNRNSTTSTVFGDAVSIPMHDKRNIAGIQMGGTELPLPAACKRPKHDTKDPEPYHQTFAGKSALPKDDQPSPFARSSLYNDVDDGQINMFNFDRDLPTFNGKMKETYMFGARMQPGAFGHMRSPNATDDQKRGFRF